VKAFEGLGMLGEEYTIQLRAGGSYFWVVRPVDFEYHTRSMWFL